MVTTPAEDMLSQLGGVPSAASVVRMKKSSPGVPPVKTSGMLTVSPATKPREKLNRRTLPAVVLWLTESSSFNWMVALSSPTVKVVGSSSFTGTSAVPALELTT